MKRAAVLAAVVIALLFWLAEGNQNSAGRKAPERSAQPESPRPAALNPALSGPALPEAADGPEADPLSAIAAVLTSDANPDVKPLPDISTPAPPPLPGADDPGPGPAIERYEGRSGRLSPNATPAGGEVTTRVSSTGGVPTLTIWVPTIRVQAYAEVAIHATLTGEQGGAVVPEEVVALIARRGGSPGPAQPLAPEPNEFVLRFKAPGPETPSNAPVIFDYVVQARGQYLGDAFTRTAAGSFLVHSTGGHLDAASARVQRRGGNLVLEISAGIDRPGTYWMYAELWGGEKFNTPIAFGRDRFERLPAGDRLLSIFFGGAMVRDSGLDGPYLIRNLRFQQVDAFPPQEAEPIVQLPPTAAFRATEFN